MGVPYKKRKPGKRLDSAAYKRAMRRVKRAVALGLPAETSTTKVNDICEPVELAAASPSLQSVPCPERECNGIAIAPVDFERGILMRCQTCGCRFNPDDVPGHLVDAEASGIFARNLAAKEASKGAGQNRDLIRGDVQSQRPRRLDGSARHVYRQDRRRRGSDTHPL